MAIMIIPVLTLLACASRRANETSPAPSSDPSSIANAEGKTLENLFAGRFPGVTVTRTDDGGLRIRIRGGSNTFIGNDEPLYVLDDSPIAAGSRGIVFINPYDIENIEVLKNPADISLYGVRGANGVIKISTKKPGKR